MDINLEKLHVNLNRREFIKLGSMVTIALTTPFPLSAFGESRSDLAQPYLLLNENLSSLSAIKNEIHGVLSSDHLRMENETTYHHSFWSQLIRDRSDSLLGITTDSTATIMETLLTRQGYRCAWVGSHRVINEFDVQHELTGRPTLVRNYRKRTVERSEPWASAFLHTLYGQGSGDSFDFSSRLEKSMQSQTITETFKTRQRTGIRSKRNWTSWGYLPPG